MRRTLDSYQYVRLERAVRLFEADDPGPEARAEP